MGFNLRLTVCVFLNIIRKFIVRIILRVSSVVTKSRTIIPEKKLPLYGPLEIDDLYQFLYNGKILFYESLEIVYKPTANPSSYNIIQYLANGTYANIYLVIDKKTKQQHAMKVMKKTTIVKLKHVKHVQDEKNISLRLNFPFVIYFEQFFLSNAYIHYVMPFIEGGELFYHLVRLGKFEEEQSRFMCAQVVLGLEYLHYLNIIYRDLKPENVMIDHTGYLKLCDFGFSKVLKGRTYTFCGTPAYIAPEVITFQGYGLAVDWWAFGVFLFELNSGLPPFCSPDQMKIYEKASTLTYTMPEYFSQELGDLITKCLQINLSSRYGNLKNGVNDIKEHQWFQSTPWMAILNRKLTSPYIPYLNTLARNSRTYNIVIKDSEHDLYPQYFRNF